jgi:nucleotide-binding universal stress UspA family protein
MAYRNIVVGFDGSPQSERALRAALGIARVARARLWVLGVEEPAPRFAPAADPRRGNGRLRAVIEAAVGLARGAGIDAEGHVSAGYPAEVIVRFGAEQACDLVVVGASEHPGGRTADKVVDRAASAVLVAR